ncbi:hypothetical protein [Oscillatoria sp. FACHB-1406]|uniref:hypothetical protein n=1 Tax=Oscillatoria sp. FACHB-1406 TaxID=2692846 RepID=UPI0016831446|nr:hypothetical protein [Oscillatoria sp. FACHB-1406]MBD2576401.1 hypothetical protein [Oscillatoria sp. FACHB-1406]
MVFNKLPSLLYRVKRNNNLGFERLMATLAALNYLLVLFDLTYIPLRDFWLQGRIQASINAGPVQAKIPPEPIIVPMLPIPVWYDWVKGIEPHRDTERYLDLVADLEKRVLQSPSLQTPEVADLLAQLRTQSDEMVTTNPFALASKTGTLEKIKNRMRQHVFGTAEASAKEAFQRFWAAENLTPDRYPSEIAFFNRQIRPLIATNYYRPTGENGEPINNFGLLDFPFFLIFALEFLGRTWFLSRRYTSISWFEAMTWRWYDILLLLPFLRGLRIIPVVTRLHQAKLINLDKIKRQTSQGIVAEIAEDITEVVVVNVLTQLQESISAGEIEKLFARTTQEQYIDLNNIDEIKEIIGLFLNVIVERVMPAVQPDIEALLQHSVDRAIAQSPVYQNFKLLPGFEQLEKKISQQLLSSLYDGLREGLKGLTQSDPQLDRLWKQFNQSLISVLQTEVKTQPTLNRLEYLLTALIEEVKVNYVQRLSQEDVEQLLEQTRKLRFAVRGKPAIVVKHSNRAP